MLQVGIVAAAAILGVGAGVSVALFKTSIKSFRTFVYEGAYSDVVHDISTAVTKLTGLLPGSSYNPEYILFPLLGGIIVSIILAIEGNDLGPGIKGIVKEVDEDKNINLRKFGVKASAAVATLGSGLSLGPEGPSVELGAGISRIISETFSFPSDVKHVMISAGCAAGVSAGFAAPLTATVFALEIVQPSVVQTSDSPSVVRAAAPAVFVASVVSFLFSNMILGGGETFTIKRDILTLLSSDPVVELPVFFGLGALAGVLSYVFRITIDLSTKFYKGEIEGLGAMAKLPKAGRPIVGALLTGVVAAQFPQVLFFGYETLGLILEGETQFSVAGLTQLGIAKMLLTANALGSGLVGGIFAPSLFLGATLGDGYESLIRSVFGLSVAGGPTYATVGAASVLAATFRAPITAVILLFELTREYGVIVPLLASTGIATLAIDILEPNDASPTWAWWWKDAQPVKPDDVEIKLRNDVLAQVTRNDGNATKAEQLLDTMYKTLAAGGDCEIKLLRQILYEMTPSGSSRSLRRQNQLLGAVSNLYLEGEIGGRPMQRVEAEKTLSACVTILSSLSSELSEDSEEVGDGDDDDDDDVDDGGRKGRKKLATFQEPALSGAPLFVQTPQDSK